MPGRGGGPGSPAGVPNVARSMPTVRNFQGGSGPMFEYPYAISGVTRDSAGTALGDCTVTLHRTNNDTVAARGVSDGSGNFRLDASNTLTHYLVAYKTGAPDREGTTVNTLVGS